VLLIIAAFVEIGLVLAISAGINRMAPSTAGTLFLVYSAVNGLTFSLIFLAYDGGTIAYAFIATAAMFGAMSVIGYTTQMDLSKLGSILFMGLIGLLVVSLLNLFIGSSFLYWVISVAGVVIFTGLTAWDTQRIKQMAQQSTMMGSDGALLQQRITIIGALTLYLDFINLFLYLLRLISALQDN
jgi:FtsH-binding integral membrane protein